MKKCSNCGRPYPDDEKFCGECGVRLEQISNSNQDNKLHSLSNDALHETIGWIVGILNCIKNTVVTLFTGSYNFIQRIQRTINSFNNLENVLQSDKNWYDFSVRIIYIGIGIWIISSGILGIAAVNDIISQETSNIYRMEKNTPDPSPFSSLLYFIVIGICFIWIAMMSYVNVYIYAKSGFLKAVFKMILGICVSILICSILSFLFKGIGIVFPILTIIAAIYGNRRRTELLKRYKPYIIYWAKIFLISATPYLLGVLLVVFALMSGSRSLPPKILLDVLLVFGSIGVCIFSHYMFRKEEAKGVKYFDFIRHFIMTPFILLFCLISFLSLLAHIDLFSSDAVFSPLEADMGLIDLDGGSLGVAKAATIHDTAGLDSQASTLQTGAPLQGAVMQPDMGAASTGSTDNLIFNNALNNAHSNPIDAATSSTGETTTSHVPRSTEVASPHPEVDSVNANNNFASSNTISNAQPNVHEVLSSSNTDMAAAHLSSGMDGNTPIIGTYVFPNTTPEMGITHPALFQSYCMADGGISQAASFVGPDGTPQFAAISSANGNVANLYNGNSQIIGHLQPHPDGNGFTATDMKGATVWDVNDNSVKDGTGKIVGHLTKTDGGKIIYTNMDGTNPVIVDGSKVTDLSGKVISSKQIL